MTANATKSPGKVLIVDDELQIRRLLRVALDPLGFEVIEASNGEDALQLAAQWSPCFVLLDLGLPGMDGIDVLRRLREWYDRPVLILSVRDEETQIVEALDTGADDYLTKPFQVNELLARIRVSLRNHARGAASEPVFELGRLRVDLSARRVCVAGAEIHLTTTEYDVLRYLVRHAGKVLTHGQILREVWGKRSAEQTQYLRVYVNHLRQKIEENPQTPKILITEPGIGYRIAIG